jgi:hypothetical protein
MFRRNLQLPSSHFFSTLLTLLVWRWGRIFLRNTDKLSFLFLGLTIFPRSLYIYILNMEPAWSIRTSVNGTAPSLYQQHSFRPWYSVVKTEAAGSSETSGDATPFSQYPYHFLHPQHTLRPWRWKQQFIRNVGRYLSDYKAAFPRRQ